MCHCRVSVGKSFLYRCSYRSRLIGHISSGDRLRLVLAQRYYDLRFALVKYRGCGCPLQIYDPISAYLFSRSRVLSMIRKGSRASFFIFIRVLAGCSCFASRKGHPQPRYFAIRLSGSASTAGRGLSASGPCRDQNSAVLLLPLIILY